MKVQLIDANTSVLCESTTDLAGRIECNIVPSTENVNIKIEDKRFTKTTETIVVTKDEKFTKQLQPLLALKFTAKLGEKLIPDLTLRLNKDILQVRTTDSNGNAFYLLQDPILDSYELEISDSNFKYYTKRVTLNVAPNKESHQFYMELQMVECRQMAFKVASKGVKLANISVTVRDVEGNQFQGGKTDNDGQIVFNVEETDTRWQMNAIFPVIVLDETQTYQPQQKNLMITGPVIQADFELVDKIKVFVTLLDAETNQPAVNVYFIANYAGKLWTTQTDDKGKATLPSVYSFMELQKNFKVQIDKDSVYKNQDCQDIILAQTVTNYECKLKRWETLQFNIKLLDLTPCVDVTATLIAEHSIKMTTNETTNKAECQVEFKTLASTGQIKIGVKYTYAVQLKGYDTVYGSVDVADLITQVGVNMVKNDNPNTAQVFIMDSVFFRPIAGLVGEFNFSGTIFWAYSNQQGIMSFAGTKAKPLNNGMAILMMNDPRVNSKGLEVFILVNQPTPQQVNLPVVGGIMITTTTEAQPTPSFQVAVTYGNGIITTGMTLSGKYVFLVPNTHGDQRSFNVVVSDSEGKYLRVTEEQITLDANNKAERTYEMKLAYTLEARAIDVNKTGIPNIQVTVKRLTTFGKNQSIATNMTDINGVFKFTSGEQIFFSKDTLYFEFVDPANRYKNESVSVNVSMGQTQVRVDKQVLNKYVIVLLNTYLTGESRIGTQSSFDFQINAVPQKRVVTDQRGVALIHQQEYPELKIGAELTFVMIGDKYLSDITSQKATVATYSQVVSIVATQRPDAPLTIDFELFDAVHLLHVRSVEIILKQDGADVQTAISSAAGKGTFSLTLPYSSTAKYEIYSKDARFNLPATAIKPNQAHFYTTFNIDPNAVVMVDYLYNNTVESVIGAIGLNVTVTENGKQIEKTLTDLNGKIAIYISKDDMAKNSDYSFAITDMANRYKPRTDVITRKANEKSTTKEIYVEQADEITINYKVQDVIFKKLQWRVQVIAKTTNVNVKMYTGRDGVVSLNTRDNIKKFALNDKVDVNFISTRMKSMDKQIVIDKPDVIGGLVEMDPFLALQFNAIDENTSKLIMSNTLTFLVTKDYYSTVTMPLTHTKDGVIQYFAEETTIDSSKDCDYNVSIFDSAQQYLEKKFIMTVKKGENKVIMDVKLTPIKPISVEYSVKLSDSVHKHQVYGVHTVLNVNNVKYTATSDFSGVVKFVGPEIVDGRDATIEIKSDSMFKDFTQAVKIDSKNIAQVEIVPLYPIKLTFTDQQGAPVKAVQAYGQYGAAQVILLGVTNDQGIIISYLPQEAITTKQLILTYKNVRYMEGSKTYDLTQKPAIEETIKLELAFFIQVHVVDETASFELPNISVSAICVSKNISFFVEVLTNATGYVTHISKTPLFAEGDQIEIVARDMSGKYKGQLQKFTMTKGQQYINVSMLMVQNYVFFVQVNDASGKGLPAAQIAVLNQKSATEPISLNVTNDNGYVMITTEFMSVSDGDTLRFVVISENYTRTEQQISFSLATKTYNITIVSAVAKTISATFVIKQCDAALATTMVVLFSQHVKKGQMNMNANCVAEFRFSESSNILAKNAEIQFNALAYGYEHYAGTQTCTGENIVIEITPKKTTEIKTMIIKVEDDVYTMPVVNNATLQLGPCQLKANSDYFGNLFFQSTADCKMYKNGDGMLNIFDELKTFEPLTKLIQINESQYYKVKPYMILKLSFEDKNNPAIKGNDMLVTVGSEAHPVIHMGKTSANGIYICRVPQSQVAPANSKYLVSYSDLELRFAQGQFDFVVPSGNKYEFTHQLVRQFTFKILANDGLNKGINGIIITVKDNKQNEVCKKETLDGFSLCVIEGAKLSLGAQIFITAEDKNKVWTTRTNTEQVPLNKYQAEYIVKMFQPVSLQLEFLSEGKPISNVAFQILKAQQVKLTGKSDANGKFVANWADGSVNLYDQLVVEVLDNRYKRSTQTVTLEKAATQQYINLQPISDISVQVKITMANCSEAQVVLFDSQKKPMFSDKTKTCAITFKNSQSHQGGLLELNGKYSARVSSAGYDVAEQTFVLQQDGQSVEVKLIKSKEGGLSTGALVGIIIGSVVAVGALVALVYLCIKKPSAALKKMNEELEMPLLNE